MTTYGPYSPVRKAGNLLFISGQIGIDPTTGMTGSTITEQTTLAVHSLEGVLINAGSSLSAVVKTTVFLQSMDDFVAMNSAYEQLFSVPRPARSTVAVRELPRVADGVPILVEIEAVAYLEQA